MEEKYKKLEERYNELKGVIEEMAGGFESPKEMYVMLGAVAAMPGLGAEKEPVLKALQILIKHHENPL